MSDASIHTNFHTLQTWDHFGWKIVSTVPIIGEFVTPNISSIISKIEGNEYIANRREILQIAKDFQISTCLRKTIQLVMLIFATKLHWIFSILAYIDFFDTIGHFHSLTETIYSLNKREINDV